MAKRGVSQQAGAKWEATREAEAVAGLPGDELLADAGMISTREPGAGEMWNSNSVIAWVVASSRIDVTSVQ